MNFLGHTVMYSNIFTVYLLLIFVHSWSRSVCILVIAVAPCYPNSEVCETATETASLCFWLEVDQHSYFGLNFQRIFIWLRTEWTAFPFVLAFQCHCYFTSVFPFVNIFEVGNRLTYLLNYWLYGWQKHALHKT